MMCYNPDSKPPQRRELDFNSTACSDFYAGSSVIDSMLVSDYWPMVVVTLCTVILLLLVVVLWFVFRDPVRVWLYSRYGVRLCSFVPPLRSTSKTETSVRRFRVLQSQRREWVVQALAAELEPKFQLCLHYRDLPHAAYMQHAAPAVLEAAEASRRVIIVLTRNFLQTEWSRFELRQALHEALKGRAFKLVILEEGPLPEAELDPELKLYLKTAERVRWGEKRFWEKLKYAMPSVEPRGKINANYRRNINNYTIDSRVVANGGSGGGGVVSHHTHHTYPEKIRHHSHHQGQAPPSPGMQMLPPPAYSAQGGATAPTEADDANYSSATTATPSPRPARRMGGGVEPRPASDHIYSSIDSDYSTLERGGSGARRGPPWRPPQHVVLPPHHHAAGNAGQAYLV
nr:unnamed protein product [Callosobruchus chinensis]